MTVGARGRENSVAGHPPPPLLRPHPPTAGWPAAGVGGPVAGAALAPETGTETGGGEDVPAAVHLTVRLAGGGVAAQTETKGGATARTGHAAETGGLILATAALVVKAAAAAGEGPRAAKGAAAAAAGGAAATAGSGTGADARAATGRGRKRRRGTEGETETRTRVKTKETKRGMPRTSKED